LAAADLFATAWRIYLKALDIPSPGYLLDGSERMSRVGASRPRGGQSRVGITFSAWQGRDQLFDQSCNMLRFV
jgi:hypothetical protein